MIEKIDQIRDLLIVPNVGEQPNIAINQMKILNLLVELRGEAERCNISNVLWRSEQLPCCYSGRHSMTGDRMNCLEFFDMIKKEWCSSEEQYKPFLNDVLTFARKYHKERNEYCG